MIFLLGCIPQASFQIVTVTGQIEATGSGPLQAEVHHAQGSVTGVLAYPGGYLETLSPDEDGSFSLTLTVPTDEGTGLAVYAWQDRDEDGLLCGLGVDDELAGAAATATLAAEVALDVWLSEPCAGPEVLIPAALAAAQP